MLGAAGEWDALDLTLDDGRVLRATLGPEAIYEDSAPRLADLDGDGAPEVIVVETAFDLGARVAVYGPEGRIAATPFIGTTHRWYAVIGAIDLDGDGLPEIVAVDRPHLAGILRVWSMVDGALVERANAAGYTNHRIGEPAQRGGLRDCGAGGEIITADSGWTEVLATRLEGQRLVTSVLWPYAGPDDLARALTCP